MLKIKNMLALSLTLVYSLFLVGCSDTDKMRREYTGIFECQDKTKYIFCNNDKHYPKYYATVMVKDKYSGQTYPSESLGTWSIKNSKILLNQSIGHHSDKYVLNLKDDKCTKISKLDMCVSGDAAKAPACNDERVKYKVIEKYKGYLLKKHEDLKNIKISLENIKTDATYSEDNRDFYKCSANLLVNFENNIMKTKIKYNSTLVWDLKTQGNIKID